MTSSAAIRKILLCTLLFLTCCATTEPSVQDNQSDAVSLPYKDYVIDEVEEFSFDENDESEIPTTPPTPDSLPAAAFRIHVSSSSYTVQQLRYLSQLALVRNNGREQRIRSLLSRYNRVDVTRTAHILISVQPSTGKLQRYRLIKSTYIKELDAIIMKDLSDLRFSIIRRNLPSVIYIVYRIQLFDSTQGDNKLFRIDEHMQERVSCRVLLI
ncbi:MAG: hypothetical protein PF637_09190 [Spirochaetes bacterium]|jgi:hypothetical protein|nr:hypothetical protein [Spirochaetota bacterium]